MIKKIDFGKTNFKDLYQVFDFRNHEEFENKKARLFPSGNTDNEVSTISIFLASLSAVKEYREELFTEIGINKIKTRNVILHTYTELSNKKTGERPDGLIVITSGKHNPIIEWACFVEAKVRDQEIEEGQIEKYVNFSRDVGINNIITISNYLVSNPLQSPIRLNKRSFKLFHWSWEYLKVTGSRLIRTDCIEDEDHVYILKELRRYFDTHKNLYNYKNMGKNWKESVNKLRFYEKEQKVDVVLLENIVKSYVQEEKDISLQLTDKSQFHIELVPSNNRIEQIESMLQSKKIITSKFLINKDKKHTFSIDVDFIRQDITCYTDIIINKGKAQAQTTALVKMFEEDSGHTDNILITAFYIRKKTTNNSYPLSKLIEEKSKSNPYSILDKNLGDEVKLFTVKTNDRLGKDFQSVKNFIIKLESIAERFLTQVLMNKRI
jgi:hypothetical protein